LLQPLPLVLLLVFIAYIIIYDEYQKHIGKKRAMRQGLEMAIFSFIVFVIVGLFSGFVFSKIVGQ